MLVFGGGTSLLMTFDISHCKRTKQQYGTDCAFGNRRGSIRHRDSGVRKIPRRSGDGGGQDARFLETNMPRGMFLRSGPDWHLDARDVATFQAYLKMRGLTRAHVKPVPLEMFLDYASWFTGQYNVTPRPALVTHLARSNGTYIATLDNGSQISADKVLLSLGFAW